MDFIQTIHGLVSNLQFFLVLVHKLLIKFKNRHGALFESPFKGKRIENDEYSRNLILYIHRNPIDLNQNFKTYKFSSCKAIISDMRTDIKKQLVIERFDNLDNFIYLHKNPPKLNFNF